MDMLTKINPRKSSKATFAVVDGRLYVDKHDYVYCMDAYRRLSRVDAQTEKMLRSNADWLVNTESIFYFNTTKNTLCDIVRYFRKKLSSERMFIRGRELIFEMSHGKNNMSYIIFDSSTGWYHFTFWSNNNIYKIEYEILGNKFHQLFESGQTACIIKSQIAIENYPTEILKGSRCIETKYPSINQKSDRYIVNALLGLQPTKIILGRLNDICVVCVE